MRLASPISLLTAIWLASPAHAQVARTEIYPLPSVTMSDSEFLTGGARGAAVTLAGILQLPKSGSDKLPAVILLHSSGGIGGAGGPVAEWSRELNALGIATFAVDSFSGRGIIDTIADQAKLGRLAMILDAYRALELLGKHPGIDPARIAVMGFSRGGQSALYSSMTRFRRMHGGASAQRFAAHISFYPDCSTTFREGDEVDGPIRVLQGDADDYNPLAACQALVERLRAKERDIQLFVYPGAHHAFDSVVLKEPRKLANATTLRRCRLSENENGVIINEETQKPFTYADPCVEKGPTVAYSEAATAGARVAVKEFLSDVFRLKR